MTWLTISFQYLVLANLVKKKTVYLTAFTNCGKVGPQWCILKPEAWTK